MAGMPSVKVIPGEERPLPVLPRAHFVVALTGMVEGKNGVRVPHSAIAEIPVTEDDSVFQLEVPHSGYATYEIRIRRHLQEPTTAEVQLGKLIIDSVPCDVWDACVAALEAETDRSLDTVFDILHGWGERLCELASIKPLEPDGRAGLESEEET
jgi:hypothetical protein